MLCWSKHANLDMVISMGLSLYYRLWGWKDPCMECRKWNEGGSTRRETHRSCYLPAVQSQVHDICKCLLQHGEKGWEFIQFYQCLFLNICFLQLSQSVLHVGSLKQQEKVTSMKLSINWTWQLHWHTELYTVQVAVSLWVWGEQSVASILCGSGVVSCWCCCDIFF